MPEFQDPETQPAGADVNVLCLLKVGREEAHMNALRAGRLYCRHLTYYTNFEGAAAAHNDAHDGLAAVYQASQVVIKFEPRGGEPIIIGPQDGLIGEVLVTRMFCQPVFCLHAIHTGDWTHRQFGDAELEAFKADIQLPLSMKKFGTYVWTITNAPEFFKRVRSAAHAQGIGIRRGRVRYLDSSRTHGAVPKNAAGFAKLNTFGDEREYRVMLEADRDLPDPFVLDVGSLEDISFVTTFDEFRSGWTVAFQHA